MLQAEISRLQGKCTQLEAALSARDQEYRKYAEKAKEVIKNLDPRMMNGELVVTELKTNLYRFIERERRLIS